MQEKVTITIHFFTIYGRKILRMRQKEVNILSLTLIVLDFIFIN